MITRSTRLTLGLTYGTLLTSERSPNLIKAILSLAAYLYLIGAPGLLGVHMTPHRRVNYPVARNHDDGDSIARYFGEI